MVGATGRAASKTVVRSARVTVVGTSSFAAPAHYYPLRSHSSVYKITVKHICVFVLGIWLFLRRWFQQNFLALFGSSFFIPLFSCLLMFQQNRCNQFTFKFFKFCHRVPMRSCKKVVFERLETLILRVSLIHDTTRFFGRVDFPLEIKFYSPSGFMDVFLDVTDPRSHILESQEFSFHFLKGKDVWIAVFDFPDSIVAFLSSVMFLFFSLMKKDRKRRRIIPFGEIFDVQKLSTFRFHCFFSFFGANFIFRCPHAWKSRCGVWQLHELFEIWALNCK